ncbi:hypothetical protein KY338_02710 [Candidatus Woesearchaeota archaeon]|nr:hypothetical protein [Candidatus Woesearchaeota archaeon]MBW3005729.1 hypothetical protein [Candidatus Woesearchaeota archaeon]
MKKRFLLGILVLFCLLLPIVFANTVELGTYVINVDSYNFVDGTYALDFWLTLKCDYDCSFDEFYIVNSIDTRSELAYHDGQVKSYLTHAKLSAPVDLREYPFDKQQMFMIIEHKQLPASELKIVPLLEFTAVDERVQIPGWRIGDWHTKVYDHWYSGWDDYWQAYYFSVELARPAIDGIIESFLPILFLALIILFTYLLGTDRLELRLGIVGSVFVALVVLHLAMTSQLPSVGHMTLLDKFVMLTYFVALCSFFINTYLLHLRHIKKNVWLKKLNDWTRYGLPIIFILCYVALFYFFFKSLV